MLHIKKSIAWILAIVMVFLFIGCTPVAEEEATPDVVEIPAELKEQYASFLDLDATNGLTVYVAMFAPESYSCSLFPTGQIDDPFMQLMNINHADLEEMKRILSTYDIAPEKITVTPYVNPLSSYLAPELFDDGAIPQLRYQLGIGEKPEVIVIDTSDGPFPYHLSWVGSNEDGDYALRYTYYPITNTYAYKNELTYVAVGIKNQQELESFSTLASNYFSLNASANGTQPFSTVVAHYDEAFFQEKGIVVVYIPSESTSIGYKLAGAALDGEELHIAITENRPNGELKAQETGWFMTVELPKETLSQANYFSAG